MLKPRMARYHFCEDLLPISLLLTRETLRMADAAEVFDYYRRLCQRRIQFVAVSDVRAAKALPDASTCQRFGEEAARFSIESRGWSLGSGIVLESTLIRGALNAIEWLYHPQSSTTYFDSMRAAIAWAIQRLEANGTAVPEAVRQFERFHARH
jgi:hypothetical protein